MKQDYNVRTKYNFDFKFIVIMFKGACPKVSGKSFFVKLLDPTNILSKVKKCKNVFASN